MLTPLRRRTWAPRGQTPVVRAWDRRERLSAIAALSLAPRNRRIGLYFRLQPKNIRTADVVAFVKALRQQLQRPIILVWDRYSVHRAAAKHLERYAWLTMEWLPAYAPELDPVEFVWNHTKYSDLANFAPYDTSHLQQAMLYSLYQQRNDPWLKCSYFRSARLAI